MTQERMMKWFTIDNDTKEVEIAQKFLLLASELEAAIEPGPERTAALRKLLEAKDAAIRAKSCPGG